jgi:DNA-binding transcriptional MerR regulator
MAHGRLLAHDVAELTGVSGTTVGQWARRGLIASSVEAGDPRVYAVEDVAEAAVVRALLDAGARHGDIHRAIAALPGPWPLSRAALAVRPDGRIALRDEDGGVSLLTARGWQRVVTSQELHEVRLALRHTAG